LNARFKHEIILEANYVVQTITFTCLQVATTAEEHVDLYGCTFLRHRGHRAYVGPINRQWWSVCERRWQSV